MREIVAYADRMHRVVREALVAPTYEQIMKVIAHSPKILQAHDKLDELKKLLRSAPNGVERQALEEEIANMRLWVDYLLPEDFMASIVAYTLCVEPDRSDIKKLSEDILLECAILAERGHDNPHDHCQGRFTPFMEKDIDRRAWYILDEKRKKLNGR